MKVLFVCHGNICRSVMAEYIFKYISNNKIYCESKATSTEEIGNDIYPPIKKVLDNHRIPYNTHHARQIEKNDYNNFDLLICFDYKNYHNLNKYYNDNLNKIHLLKEYINDDGEVTDPWYSRNFEECYEEIRKCVEALYNTIK